MTRAANAFNVFNMMTTRRKPRSLPAAVRARQLRLAGLAETNRLKYELTMLVVAS